VGKVIYRLNQGLIVLGHGVQHVVLDLESGTRNGLVDLALGLQGRAAGHSAVRCAEKHNARYGICDAEIPLVPKGQFVGLLSMEQNTSAMSSAALSWPRDNKRRPYPLNDDASKTVNHKNDGAVLAFLLVKID